MKEQDLSTIACTCSGVKLGKHKYIFIENNVTEDIYPEEMSKHLYPLYKLL
jgi:hypothetical protein